MRRRARVLAVAAAILASASSVARSDDALFRSLANPRIEGHEEALAAWENLEPSARLARIREGLRSRDPVVAGLAASLADPMALDLEELRRAMRLNAWDPNWVEHPGYAYGIPEIPAIARIAATTPGFTVVSWGRHCNFDVALDASAAAEIVPLLETPNGEVAWRLAEWLDRMAETTTRTETRPVLAQGFNYWRARRAAEESGRLVPPLASFVSDAKGRGVSPALEALVRGALADEAAEGGAIEDPWLMRWLWDVAPTTSDLPLLVDAVAARAKSPEIAGWAVRALAELDPRGEASGWHRLADGSDFAAVAAASESARLGRPERLRALQDAGGALADRAAIHAWETDPENARRRWLARAVAGSSAAAPRLDAAARVHYEHGLGVKIRDEDVARLGEALAENAIAARGVPRFLAATCPDAVSRPVAAAMAKRLAAPPAEDEEDETFDAATLACLEARAPGDLATLLVERARAAPDPQPLAALARLGDATLVDAMLASWREWWDGLAALGRVRDPRVATYLRENAASDDPSVHACAALAVALGAPMDVQRAFERVHDDTVPDRDARFAAARERLLAGDLEAALLAMTGGGPELLGSIGSPTAIDRLRRLREERLVDGKPVYWTATAELAVAGDADALAEWRAFVREGRIWMLAELEGPAGRALDAHPETVADWLPLVESSGHHQYYALNALLRAFPTAPVDEDVEPAINRVAFERWHAKHAGTFVRSRLLDGWIPGPRAR